MAAVSRPRVGHIGLGAFARAHQAWYTQAAGGDWRIIASPSRILPALEEQGFRYGLLTRGPEGDSVEAIESVIAAERDVESLVSLHDVAVVTLTVTEAGYLHDAPVVQQLARGLAARRARGVGSLTIVPCDNVPSNGRVLHDVVLAASRPENRRWIDDTVSFASTMVDRITPATTPTDVEVAESLLGWPDEVPVVTEPFTEWVLQGDFPGGRPEWEKGGAEFVDDVEPYEQRKLWMLNAAHSLMAYRGIELGHETVFEAWHDATLAAEVEQLWAEARPVVRLEPAALDGWLDGLRQRWENPRMEHRLEQIAQGGEQKIPARIGAVISAREEAGLPAGTAELETLAAWERYKKEHH